MHRKPYVMPLNADFQLNDSACDLDQLLHPAQAFEHPSNVVNDPDLTLNEKRAILASWASDACAIEASPALRRAPGARQPVRFYDVMEALGDLDRQTKENAASAARYRRTVRRERLNLRRGPSDQGQGPTLTRRGVSAEQMEVSRFEGPGMLSVAFIFAILVR